MCSWTLLCMLALRLRLYCDICVHCPKKMAPVSNNLMHLVYTGIRVQCVFTHIHMNTHTYMQAVKALLEVVESGGRNIEVATMRVSYKQCVFEYAHANFQETEVHTHRKRLRPANFLHIHCKFLGHIFSNLGKSLHFETLCVVPSHLRHIVLFFSHREIVCCLLICECNTSFCAHAKRFCSHQRACSVHESKSWNIHTHADGRVAQDLERSGG